MYPYLPAIGPIHFFHSTFGPFQPGTFGLMLWLAAVVAVFVLQRNFTRHRVAADALNIVALVVIFGIVGAKSWHELENLRELRYSLVLITRPGWGHPLDVLINFLGWFRDGFAWFGGLSAGIALLMIEGHRARFKGPNWKSLEQPGTPGPRLGAVRMLDLAAPAAAIGYGIGRIGCLLSGDGDYGIDTTLPWGVHMAKNALVPPNPPNALVQPTPIYELLFALALFWLLWQLGKRAHPIGWMTGVYLTLSGVGRFLVEFVRINPKLYFHHTMSNAQVAALLSAIAGFLIVLASESRGAHSSASEPVHLPS